MKADNTSKVEAEIRKIRADIHAEATAAGWDKYFAALHKRAGFFFGKFPSRNLSARRRKLSTATPEPNAVQEVRRWRQQVQKRAEKVGWEKYLEELNKRPALWVEKPVAVVREKPAKKYGK